MIALDKKYADVLESIKTSIQGSESLSQYLEEEEETYYKELQDEVEPQIEQLYNEVANHSPLQLEAFETHLLEDGFEGLFLPRILGYNVLRGEIDDNYKYRKPQDHFKKILLAICNSANFEVLRKRIGQTIQVGFALSSDIWITNIIDSIPNKKIRAYLMGMKQEKFRDAKARMQAYDNYRMQFEHANFKSVEFPKNIFELKSTFYALRTFIIHRSDDTMDNESLMRHLSNFIGNEALYESDQFLELLIIFGLKYKLDDATKKAYNKAINTIAQKHTNFSKSFFAIYDNLFTGKEVKITPENEHNIGKLLVDIKDSQIIEYFKTTNELHSKGFVNVDAIEAVRKYYEKHPGMSLENECLRSSVHSYISKFLSNIGPEHYGDYFEINKIITAYIGIFNNERFNQEVKNESMAFIDKCIKLYTDKRGKDYQDIKKYVSATFVDLGFLKDKEVSELFKTRRKKTA